MGICYQGKTLRQAVDGRDDLFARTGYCYGLDRIELVEDDPAKFMRFQMRMVAACINARETAKYIAANPVSMLQGELLFMLATPEGDVAAASYGLAGHVQSVPFVIRSLAALNFEERPGIREGDIFGTNDAYYGSPHGSDCFTLVPVFYKGELIAWTVGLNHVTDIGAIQPGSLSFISPSSFTDGFLYPPLKTGENFEQHRWWELFWQRRTRTGVFNIMDDKMRVAGAVGLHDLVLDLVEEFGVDYFRRGLREILERERRVLLERVRAQAVPGTYHYLFFLPIRYKGVVGELFPSSNRNWLIHEPAEFLVRPDGALSIDLEGLSSEDDFHINAYEPGVRVASSLGTWPMFAYTITLNTSLMYMTEWNLPPGSLFNPQNPHAGTSMSLTPSAKYMFMFSQCLTRAFFARGFLEEAYPSNSAGVGYGLSGALADGHRWGGGDISLITCSSSSALPYRDGDVASACAPNPAPDMGEVELAEYIQPTQLNIGRRILSNYCGHGKFRGGLGLGLCQLIVDPGRQLTIAGFSALGGPGRAAMGMCGGYPGANDVICFAHDTNMRELLNQGKPYPRDFIEMREWLKEGVLKAGSVRKYQGATPNIQCRDGDLFAIASSAMGGWGDPLEREPGLVQNDVGQGWITPDVAQTVYGVMVDGKGGVQAAESVKLRQEMRRRREESSVDARDWWEKEREHVLKRAFHEDVYNMYADSLKYDKFRRQFAGMWQLTDDFVLQENTARAS